MFAEARREKGGVPRKRESSFIKSSSKKRIREFNQNSKEGGGKNPVFGQEGKEEKKLGWTFQVPRKRKFKMCQGQS